jgi:DNA-binding NarL/FixJ family response regulator
MFDTLSNREKEVTVLVSKGFSNKEVGQALSLTEKTIKFHLGNIYKKLGVKTRLQLSIKAIRADFPKLEVLSEEEK